MLAGVFPLTGDTASHWLSAPGAVPAVKGIATAGSELVRLIGNWTLGPFCCRVTEVRPAGIPMFRTGLWLMNSVTPMVTEVVPFPALVELTAIAPVHAPGLSPVVTMLTVMVAGVVPVALGWLGSQRYGGSCWWAP